METDRFDTLTRTIAPLLSRRGLAALGLVTLASLGIASDATAGKKRKKHKHKKKGQNCSDCAACQQADNGLACGGSGVCINGVCAQTCDPNGDGCAGSAGCTTRKAEDGSVCVPDSGDPCLNTNCADDADCPGGQACVSLLCIDFPKGHCALVITAG